jgi:biopolymer transport protein ExbD
LKVGNTGGGHRRHHKLPMAEINIIPLVDITLVLLIIFMATTAFVNDAAIKLSLPKASNSSAVNDDNKDIDIALAQTGAIYLDGHSSSNAEIESAMNAGARRVPQPRVIIKGDENVAYKRIVAVMDMARGAGLPKVALGTRLPDIETARR